MLAPQTPKIFANSGTPSTQQLFPDAGAWQVAALWCPGFTWATARAGTSRAVEL